MRTSTLERNTFETKINLTLNIDGTGISNISTGIGFLDHMLILFSKHSSMDLDVSAAGDLYVDNHHTVEDVGILLGQAIRAALGDRVGIKRYGSAFTPMDEALTLCSLDLSNRPFLVFDYEFKAQRLGEFETETVKEFLYGLVYNSGMCLHVNVMSGANTHHIIESIFKGFARALKEASVIDPNIKGVLSTKGCL